jgi:hypothetical protein
MTTKHRLLTVLLTILTAAAWGTLSGCNVPAGPDDGNPPSNGDDPGDDDPGDDDPSDDDPGDDDPGDDDPGDDDPGDDDPGDDDPGDDDPGDDDPGDDDPGDDEGPLAVSAGENRTVFSAGDVTLTCTQTDGPPTTRFVWHQTGGGDVGVDGSTSASVTFTAPENSDTLTFACEAKLGTDVSPPASVTVNVRTRTLALLTQEGNNAPNILSATDGTFGAIDTSIVRISPTGTVAFHSQLSGTSNSDGIFTAAGTTIAAVARMNDTAPSTNGRAFDTFHGFSINAKNEVAFTSIVNLSSARGVFIDDGVTTSLLGLQSQPNGPAGESYVTISTGVAIDDFSDVRYTGQTNRTGQAQLLTHVGSAAQFIFSQATTAPDVGETFAAFGATSRNVAASPNGHFVFAGRTATKIGVFLLPRPGMLQSVAIAGQAAPGGGTYSWPDLDAVVLDVADGDDAQPYIAIAAPIEGDTASHKIVVLRGGQAAEVAAIGETTPGGTTAGGTTASGTDTFTSFEDIAVSAGGHVAFVATTATETTGLYFHDAITGATIEVAAVGGAVPAGGTFARFYAVDMNDSDTIAFVADISTGKTGIFTAGIP